MRVALIEIVTSKEVIRQGEKVVLLLTSNKPTHNHILNIFDHHFSVEEYLGGSDFAEHAYNTIYMGLELRVDDLMWGDHVSLIRKKKVTPERVSDRNKQKQNKNT